MSLPKNKQKSSLQENRYLKRVNAVFFILLLFLAIGVWRIPTMLTIYTAPDISKSFVQKNGDIPLHSVYGFARVFWESLNYCEEDCGKEFLPTLKKYKAYITQTCQHDLEKHFKESGNLYNFRSRLLLPTDDVLFDPANIKQVSSNMWYVKLKYNLKDYVGSVLTRDNIMLYPIKVIRSNKPKSINPLGMEINCYFGKGPVVLEKRPTKKEAH